MAVNELALNQNSIVDQAKVDFFKTTTRKITRRGVMWLGQTCNIRCHFCYFLDRINATDHPEHPFMTLEKAKRICSTLVDVYDNNAIDIQGGEPTLFRHINELVEHCRKIGFMATLTTNSAAPQGLREWRGA